MQTWQGRPNIQSTSTIPNFSQSNPNSNLTVLPVSRVKQERPHRLIDGSAAQPMRICGKMLQENHRTYMLVEATRLQSSPQMLVETWVNNRQDSLLGLLHVFIVQESPNCKTAIQRTGTGPGCVRAGRAACWSVTDRQVVHIYTETSHRGKRNSIPKQKKVYQANSWYESTPTKHSKKGTLFYYCFSF